MLLDDVRKLIQANTERIIGGRRPGETRQQLAKRIGIGDGTLGRLLDNGGNPQLKTLVSLADALKVQPWELLSPEDKVLHVREEPTRYGDADQLVDAIRIAEELIDEAGRVRMTPRQRAAVIHAVLRLQDQGVGMDSARAIVADFLATTAEGESEHGINRRHPGRTGKDDQR